MTSSTAASVSAAPAEAPAAASAPPPAAVVAGGDSDSAALLRMLRTNAVTPSKDPVSASPSAAMTFTTPTLASRSATLLPASTSKAVNATPPSGRRGPGRPKKSESGSKNAAKWDDDVTSLLLKFRYNDMKNAFEGVRNNVEVGECWIQLAQELTRRSGKSFDSHQCQSKLRNLKKTWREMSSSSKITASSATSPLYQLLSQYLGADGGSSRRASAGGNGSSNDTTVTTDAVSGEAIIIPGVSRDGTAASSRRSRSASVEEADVQGMQAEEQLDNGVEVDSANTGEDTEDEDIEGQDGSEQASTAASSAGEEPQIAVGTGTTETAGATVTRRIRSESLSSAASSVSSSAVPPPAKRQKQIKLASKTATPATTTGDEVAATPSTSAAAAIPAAAIAAVANLSGGHIDSSLLSVASGLRTMMEGVLASKEESSDQQILAELREHNTLMKQYCKEVSKQTTSLNALIELLTEKFGSNPYKHSSDHTAYASKSVNKTDEVSKKEGRPTGLSVAARNYRAKQLNPNNPLYHKCRGGTGEKEKPASLPKAAVEYRAKQLNPNNLLYIKSRTGSSDSDHLAEPKQE